MPASPLRKILVALLVCLIPWLATAHADQPGIVIIGASAKSSTEIIRQALLAGYRVTGVARHPEDLALRARNSRC